MDESEYSPQPVRNPSPPPELKQNEEAVCGDSIGGTAFSKHWLFTTLMKLIQEVDKETEAKEGLESSSEFGVDVDEELQTELCKLWDMSMNSDVAKFLQEFKAVDILTGVISKSQAPRVTEICVGILGNMACDQQVCEEIANNEKLVHLVLELLSNSDPPTLVETTRLLYTSLSTKSVSHFWLEAVSQAEGFKEQVAFLFHSSTNYLACSAHDNLFQFTSYFVSAPPKPPPPLSTNSRHAADDSFYTSVVREVGWRLA
ncbi:hypothetical protein BaRGS_00026874, partial [Batillaria attramentaria]